MSDLRRLWSEDNMRWAMAPTAIEPGQPFEWAGRHCVAIQMTDKTLRYREVKPKGQPQ